MQIIRQHILSYAQGGLTIYASYLAKLLGRVARDYESTAVLVELLALRGQLGQAQEVFEQAGFEQDPDVDRQVGFSAWMAMVTRRLDDAEKLLQPYGY